MRNETATYSDLIENLEALYTDHIKRCYNEYFHEFLEQIKLILPIFVENNEITNSMSFWMDVCDKNIPSLQFNPPKMMEIEEFIDLAGKTVLLFPQMKRYAGVKDYTVGKYWDLTFNEVLEEARKISSLLSFLVFPSQDGGVEIYRSFVFLENFSKSPTNSVEVTRIKHPENVKALFYYRAAFLVPLIKKTKLEKNDDRPLGPELNGYFQEIKYFNS